jgi:chitinase
VYDADNEDMISYDNAKSMAAKGAFIKKTGLKGFAVWEAGGDSNNILINAIRSSAGF